MQNENSEGAKIAMKINSLTVFSAGILITTSIFSAAYFYLKNEIPNNESETNNNLPSEETIIAQLEEKGYVVMNEEELSQLKNLENSESEETVANEDKDINGNSETGQSEVNDEDTGTSKEEQNSPKEISITVSPGMTSYDIGKQLSAAGFIDIDAFTFSKEVDKRGLASRLQLGNYTVKSTMTIEDIISLFFR